MANLNPDLGRVIVALDYDEPTKAMALVDQLADSIQWYKLGSVLFTRSGTELIDFLHKRRKKIFVDLKLFDTPMVVHDTIRQLGDLGVQFTTVHCMGGYQMLEAAARGCRGTLVKLLGVTLLTSQHHKEMREWGITESENDFMARLLTIALESRLAGVLCSAHEVTSMRAKSPTGFLTFAAGIRIPGKEVYLDDQKRVSSPKEALATGADYLIVGRPITQAREPVQVVSNLLLA